MGISITTLIYAGDRRPEPLNISVELECDEATGFFCRGVEKFVSPEGYVGCHNDAMNAGWLERQAPRGRIWLCRACSGK
jgi:hypothetical protein